MMGEVIRVSGRVPDIGEFLREAMMSQRFADVALCCPGGPKFLAHRLVLSAASPYLQEVLVAHSRTNGHYEPITIILAEVEAPELAALLGFVYTGSATVPRPRLSAFLRAAEALHIKLPPVPVAMTCGEEAGCKQEDVKDVKDVKVNPKYLQCDQYPLYDRWYQSNRVCNPINSSLELTDTDEGRQLRSQKFRYSPADRHSRGSIWQIGSMLNNMMANPTTTTTTTITQENRTFCYPNESNLASVGTRYRMDSGVDPETVHPTDPANFSSIARKSLLGSHRPASPNMYNSQESSFPKALEEKLKANYDTRGITVLPSDRGMMDPLRALSRKTFYDESEIIRRHCNGSRGNGGIANETTDSGVSPPNFVNHPTSPATATATNYVGGEDLTCRETCCRWRAPKRHVANRVTASPWRQIVRPHHSPRQPMVHHHQPENLEVRNPVTVPEAVRIHGATTAALINPEDRLVPEAFKVDQQHHHHHHQVSYGGYEVSYDANAIKEPITTMAVVDSPPSGPRFQEPMQHQEQLYRPRLPPFPARAKSTATGFFQSPGNHLESVLPPPPPPPAIALSNSLENWEPVPRQTPQKPELSHPISRLCDTLESSEKRENFDSQMIEERKMGEIISKEEEVKVEEDDEEQEEEQQQQQQEEEEEGEEKEKKKNERLLLSDRNNNNSNSNNNNSDKSDTRRNSESGTLLVIDETGRNPGGGGGGCQEDHKCDQCGKSFVTRASLKVHGRTHSGEKPFRCADCGKQFSQLRNYKYHRSVHEGTREFAATCPECGKYFNDRGYLSSHMKIHRNRKEYGCTECGKSFNQRVAYNMHVRIHTGVKPHQCDQCGKAFSRKMLLKQHLRTHSGERPYQCQVCQKAFADRSNMTLHTRLHSGLKPYQCTLCSKAFTKKHHLKTHLNYHTGTKPYSCPNCALRFSQSSNMRTHYKKCTINNPAGVKSEHARVADEKMMMIERERITSTTTDTLTPPTSDQESTSSILAPVVAAKLPPVQSPLKL